MVYGQSNLEYGDDLTLEHLLRHPVLLVRFNLSYDGGFTDLSFDFFFFFRSKNFMN